MTDDLQTPKESNWSWKGLRERLDSLWGKQYWKSFEEIADSEIFKRYTAHEFPDGAFDKDMSRRDFLKFMGASLMLAGLGGCSRQPTEKIVPYVKMPEKMIPGKPFYFATSMPMSWWARPVLVESHMGRPTKIEGNPEHPDSLGATDLFAQASVLGLYDPDRSQAVRHLGRLISWSSFVNDFGNLVDGKNATKGSGLHILTEAVSSPTLLNQIEKILARFPNAKWHRYEAAAYDNTRKGAELAFGENVQAFYRIEKANVIVSLDADFLGLDPSSIRHTKEFSKRRKVREGGREMNRLYMAESTPTVTGTMADHRWALRSAEIEAFAFALANELGVNAGSGFSAPADVIKAIAKDLKAHRGASLVIAGESQPPMVHALAHAMNEALGNLDHTVTFLAPNDPHPASSLDSLKELVDDMDAGKVDALLIVGANPVFDAPVDFDFAAKMKKVNWRAHLSLYEDETSALCHWHIPQSHYLESWSDVRSADGRANLIQPLIEPLYGGKSAHEVLAIAAGQSGAQGYDILRDYWKARMGANFEGVWKKSLNDGWLGFLAPQKKSVSLKSVRFHYFGTNYPDGTIEIQFRPDPSIWDGRFANNGWLQELPKPLTKLTWDNALLIAPALAEKAGLKDGDLVALESQDKKLEIPVWVLPGHPDNAGTLYFGFGRTRSGKIGTGTGRDIYGFRPSSNIWSAAGVTWKKVGKKEELATTQHHHSMEGRDLVRSTFLVDYLKNPEAAIPEGHHADISLYPTVEYKEYAWGMAIDLNACTGCNACIVACQSENNIPIVGKEQVIHGREMHWIRVDRYYQGDMDHPEAVHQPVLCMHCENAPCEPVCPVGATVHSDEGLNDMVYNRCVGTRYCSNNCPYKVRRFNFLDYADKHVESLKLMRNPDVTIRARGVMEKCTYCVQRINHARIDAKKESRKIRDGEIVTACQATCPADAIVFGDINDPQSEVSKLKAQPLNYLLLEELNTKPRTSYLARLRNPNPEIAVPVAGVLHGAGGH